MFTKPHISILFRFTRMQSTVTTYTCNISFNNILLDMVSIKYFFLVPVVINIFCIRSSTPDTCYMFCLSPLYQLTHSSLSLHSDPQTSVDRTPHQYTHTYTHTTRTDLHIHRHCRPFRSLQQLTLSPARGHQRTCV